MSLKLPLQCLLRKTQCLNSKPTENIVTVPFSISLYVLKSTVVRSGLNAYNLQGKWWHDDNSNKTLFMLSAHIVLNCVSWWVRDLNKRLLTITSHILCYGTQWGLYLSFPNTYQPCSQVSFPVSPAVFARLWPLL